MIYPASFSDTESGKPVLYRGSWTVTFKKTLGHARARFAGTDH
jgi:hypothetical protein